MKDAEIYNENHSQWRAGRLCVNWPSPWRYFTDRHLYRKVKTFLTLKSRHNSSKSQIFSTFCQAPVHFSFSETDLLVALTTQTYSEHRVHIVLHAAKSSSLPGGVDRGRELHRLPDPQFADGEIIFSNLGASSFPVADE